MTDWTMLPFPGGWNDQPQWVIDDFRTLLMVKRWHAINEKLPDATGLPNIEDDN